jgi:hypothetical protein
MGTPAQIRKRVHKLQKEIAAIQAANDRDRLKPRELTTRYKELDRKQRLQRILEELSSLTDSSTNELK